MLRKTALFLNWSILAILAIGICFELTMPLLAEKDGTIGIIGGKDGPTAIWVTSNMSMTSYVQLFLLIVMPVINILALKKSK